MARRMVIIVVDEQAEFDRRMADLDRSLGLLRRRVALIARLLAYPRWRA